MTSSAELVAARMKATAEIRRLAPNIGKDTEEVLADMYTAKQLVGTASDEPITVDGICRLSIAQGAQINQLVRQSETNKSLEIGFHHGFSTVWILDGLRSRRNSRHIAIDPFEISAWRGVGLYQVKRLSGAPDFEWIGDYSIHALSKLIKSEEKFDFIFIDGSHLFDDVIVDFYLSDQLVSPGGLVAFDDMWMPAVRTAISFILTNRQYKIVPQPVQNMMVLKKIADDNRDWLHFEKFRVYQNESDSKLKRMVLDLARTTGTEAMLRRIYSRYRRRNGFS
jgi:predicted O-methyltransferase YrrM